MNIGKKYEQKFRQLFKDIKCWIWRIPDYSLTGDKHTAPGDYMVVKNGRCYLFEVKHTNSKTSFPLSNISYGQITQLKKFVNEGKGYAFVVIFNPDGIWILPIQSIIHFMGISVRKSIPFDLIKKIHWAIEDFKEVLK